MSQVFINFRGRDQAGFAALLDRDLSETFGRDAVFLSSRSIRPGDDFVEELLHNLRVSTVLLAVIGPDWLRYGDPTSDELGGITDWVRWEIAEALELGIRVIPVLVEDATLPTESELPKDIAALSRCQHLRLHHRNIDHDLARVREEVARLIPLATARKGGSAEAAHSGVRLFQVSPPGRCPCLIGVVAGDILRVHTADIWVNSENSHMEMSRPNEFTISAVVRYWGSHRDTTGAVAEDVIANELAALVGSRRPVAPGTVFVTGPGALAESHNVRHIIHVAAVYGEPGAGFRQVRDIGSCVRNALIQADRLAGADESVRTILFPLLGAGVGAAKPGPTAVTMISVMADYLVTRPDTALRRIYLLGYSDTEFRTVTSCLLASNRLVPIDGPDQP